MVFYFFNRLSLKVFIFVLNIINNTLAMNLKKTTLCFFILFCGIRLLFASNQDQKAGRLNAVKSSCDIEFDLPYMQSSVMIYKLGEYYCSTATTFAEGCLISLYVNNVKK